ncbi:MAG: RNA polymerase sigma factor [Mariniblastus sp.]
MFQTDWDELIDQTQLKKRLAKGETEAFVELYDWLGDGINRYLASRLNPTDCQDVLQEVFARLVRYHLRLGKAKNLTAYVFLVARNESNRWLSSQKKPLAKSITSMVEFKSGHADFDIADNNRPSEQFENRDLARRLLEELGHEDREVVLLKIYSGLTFEEVAKILGMPAATAATKYRRAIKKLKDEFEDDSHEPSPNKRGAETQ